MFLLLFYLDVCDEHRCEYCASHCQQLLGEIFVCIYPVGTRFRLYTEFNEKTNLVPKGSHITLGCSGVVLACKSERSTSVRHLTWHHAKPLRKSNHGLSQAT